MGPAPVLQIISKSPNRAYLLRPVTYSTSSLELSLITFPSPEISPLSAILFDPYNFLIMDGKKQQHT